jgi:hypothetical protein
MTKTELRAALFERIGDRIESAPQDGASAEGTYSDTVHNEQRAHVAGMRSARLAAIKLIDELSM